MSRIDYCNSALAGLPQSTTAPLQRVQNAAARLVFQLGPKEHVTPSLLQLHWLPVRWRVQFKICCLMHRINRGNSPEYLKNIARSVAASRRRPGLRSALSTDYVLPRLWTKFGERAFSHAGPSAWNALPEDIRATSDSTVFRNQLKTHYFSLAFNAC